MKMLKEKFSPVLALTRSADFLNIRKPTDDLGRLADNINRLGRGRIAENKPICTPLQKYSSVQFLPITHRCRFAQGGRR